MRATAATATAANDFDDFDDLDDLWFMASPLDVHFRG